MSISMLISSCEANDSREQIPPTPSETMYKMPDEAELHEGTWLQWPHQYQHGLAYRNELDDTWIAMTMALQESEKVHIIAYNITEKQRITTLLTDRNIPLTNIDFYLFKTDDVWVRDNGPIYVRNAQGELLIQDWGFNGWGQKYDYTNCDKIPSLIAKQTNTTSVDLSAIITNEGGSIEIDTDGVFLATKSAILSQAPEYTVRNPGMNQTTAESIISKYLGAKKFIWLDGGFSDEDITDMHIDGIAKFANNTTIVTMNEHDLQEWGVTSKDINTLYQATNINNQTYTKVILPLTAQDVVTKKGKHLNYKGSYINYYIANNVVLVPNYQDPNDTVANQIIASLYPNRKVIGIDVRNLYKYGGMIHCVTQQQPAK